MADIDFPLRDYGRWIKGYIYFTDGATGSNINASNASIINSIVWGGYGR